MLRLIDPVPLLIHIIMLFILHSLHVLSPFSLAFRLHVSGLRIFVWFERQLIVTGRAINSRLIQGLTCLADNAWLAGSLSFIVTYLYLISQHQRSAGTQSPRCVYSNTPRAVLASCHGEGGLRPSGNGGKKNWRCWPAAFVFQLEPWPRTHAPSGLWVAALRQSTRLRMLLSRAIG